MKRLKTETRLNYLVRVAAKFITRHAPDSTIRYDEAECDGSCLADDLNTELEMHNDRSGVMLEGIIPGVDWNVEAIEGTKGVRVVDPSGSIVASIDSVAANPRQARDMADLIAAAPRMARALHAFWVAHQGMPDDVTFGPGLTNGHFHEAADILHALDLLPGGVPWVTAPRKGTEVNPDSEHCKV